MARSRKTAEKVEGEEIPRAVAKAKIRVDSTIGPGAPAGQKVPKGTKWTLHGEKSGVPLHEGISATSAPHLLAGRTSRPLADVELAGEVVTELDGRRYILKRTE